MESSHTHTHTRSARFSPAAALKCPLVFSLLRGIFSSSCGLRRQDMFSVKAELTSTVRVVAQVEFIRCYVFVRWGNFRVFKIVDLSEKHGRISLQLWPIKAFRRAVITAKNGRASKYSFNDVNEDFLKLRENSSQENDFMHRYVAFWSVGSRTQN